MSKNCSECQRSKNEYYISIGKVLCFDCWDFYRKTGKDVSKYRYVSPSENSKMEQIAYERQKIEREQKERQDLINKITRMGIEGWAQSVKQQYEKNREYSHNEIKYAPENYLINLIHKNVKYCKKDFSYDENGNRDYYEDWYSLNDRINEINLSKAKETPKTERTGEFERIQAAYFEVRKIEAKKKE